MIFEKGIGRARRRIAGHHNSLDPAFDQKQGILNGEIENLFARFSAVGKAGHVSEIDQGFLRQEAAYLADNGEPPDAGIENPDGIP